ncbi:MAG: hypothetical protein SFW67_26900 [Myxococcaceae bacterium]|nr:hypothetical protein [Myxococcaceae bacterium]
MDPLVIEQSVRPGAAGGLVKLVQEWLTLHGVPVPISSTYDVATTAAVSQFRVQRGLGPGALVEPPVFDSLVRPMLRALAPIEPQDDFAAAVLAVAEQQLAERPLEVGGPNQGPWVRLYMNGREGPTQAWCAGFVSWCLSQASIARGEAMPVKPSVSCDGLGTGARDRGRLLRGANAARVVRPGNLFLVPRRDAEGYLHAGVVREVRATTFESVEGNASPSPRTHGDRVLSQQHAYADCDFIVF